MNNNLLKKRTGKDKYNIDFNFFEGGKAQDERGRNSERKRKTKCTVMKAKKC